MKLYKLYEQVLAEGKIKKGSPEELVDMLKFLPIDETAKDLTEQIMDDLRDYYSHGRKLDREVYTYIPEDKCLKPYELKVLFSTVNSPRIGESRQHFIHVQHLHGFKAKDNYNPIYLGKLIYKIIKHECSHFYMELKGVEECLYNTHADGLKKYYQDRQELVLHGREIFEDFIEGNPDWQTYSLDRIQKNITRRVRNLRNNKGVPGLFNGGVQLKYILFIMKNYVKPNYTNPKYSPPERNVILDKGQREVLNNALMVINNINNSGNDFKKEIDTGYGPNGSNGVKFKIKNKEQGDFDVKLEVRVVPKELRGTKQDLPYRVSVSRGYKGDVDYFKNFDELINFIKTIKLTDYVKGDGVNSTSSKDTVYEKITRLLKSGDKDNIDLAFVIAKNQGINPNSLNKLLKLYQK